MNPATTSTGSMPQKTFDAKNIALESWPAWPEKDTLEGEVDRLGQRPAQERLAHAGQALQQHVAAADQGHQQVLDNVLLADNRLADLAA